MADKTIIHDDMKLYTTADHYYIVPTIYPTEVLVIDRVSGETTVKGFETVKIPIPLQVYKPVCGFLGTIKLISGLYLILAKYRICVGKLNDHDIYQLAGHELLPFARSNTHLSGKQIEDNSVYESMVRYALEAPGLYFSYGYDLTHTMQRLYQASPDFHKMSLATRADPRFLWNRHLLKDFTHEMYSRFALPLIQGFVSIHRVQLNGGAPLCWALVSRRAVDRAGTRHFRRGVDAQGHVANFVETEQIVDRGSEKTSFVQTRGSIPLYWSQYPTLKYKPPMVISGDDHVAAYTQHLIAQQQIYGNQVLINLIDQRGSEGALERGYRAAAAAAALPGVRYEPFDFHAECRGMRYERLHVLLDRLDHELSEFGALSVRGSMVARAQGGVFRTNCVDCLDRTNVVQSLLARRQLEATLARPLPDHFDQLFKTVWADHADMISVQYSGTGALKTDYTRTGKRSVLGALRDGINSLTRYYRNNFCDGYRQDSMELLLGRYLVRPGEGLTVPCPLERTRDWRYFAFPSILLVATAMFCASAVFPQQYNKEVLLYMMMWGACVGVTLSIIFRRGKLYVDWPRLGNEASTFALEDNSYL